MYIHWILKTYMHPRNANLYPDIKSDLRKCPHAPVPSILCFQKKQRSDIFHHRLLLPVPALYINGTMQDKYVSFSKSVLRAIYIVVHVSGLFLYVAEQRPPRQLCHRSLPVALVTAECRPKAPWCHILLCTSCSSGLLLGSSLSPHFTLALGRSSSWI